MASQSEGRALKVLHVIGDLELGGAETLLYRLAVHELPGIHQEVICLGARDWYSGRLAEQGIPVHHLGMNSPLTTLAGLGKFRRLLRSRGADVVQSWMYFANMLSALAARRSGTPVVWGIHNSSFDRVGLPSRLCAYAGGAGAGRLAKAVINCSERSSEIHAKLGYSAAPGTIIPNGYDPFGFHPDPEVRAATRRSLGLGDETFVIGAIARWHPHKDIPNLLRAARKAADRGVPLRCLLIGRGLEPDNSDLATAIRDSGCEDLVVLLGARADISDVARALDLHILPSHSEAFPNVVAETMLSGTPNAVTDVGDAAMMVGRTGWVVPPRDPASLSSAIEEAWRESAGQGDAWERRRELGRRRIVENFTFDRMADAYAQVWRDVARAA